MGIFPQNIGAEGMDGRNLCQIDPAELPLQVAVARPFGQGRGNRFGDFSPQLRRRSFRICDDQKAVDILGVRRIADTLQHPIH